MRSVPFTFPSGTTEYLSDATIDDLQAKAPPASSVIITDETVAALYRERLAGYRIVTIPPGEAHKTPETVSAIAGRLLELGAHRGTLLVGLGGGVVTDITGFVAGIYMRGVPFAFVPTTLLAMVDAAIGGKNGVNLGAHKNMLGTIRQPAFILYDTACLLTLPDEQWSNGFAEIIKYGYIADARILTTLQQGDIVYFQKHPHQLAGLIEGCVAIKNRIVHADEGETGLRKVLNFGHTAGHAFEMLGPMPHGYAVGMGMIIAMRLSRRYKNLPEPVMHQLTDLLERYRLPTDFQYQPQAALDLIRLDKKGRDGTIDYVLIEKPGVAVMQQLTPEEILPHL